MASQVSCLLTPSAQSRFTLCSKGHLRRQLPFGVHRGVAPRTSQVVRAAALAPPAPLEVRKFDGSVSGAEQLSLKVAESSARGLVHRYLVTVRQNARRGTASTLTRSEVRGGGRKPFKQKGSGNARQGSKRSPLIAGGGVVFGPKPRDWSIKMNKKEKRLAFATAFQSATPSLIVVEDLKESVTAPKTKTFVEAMRKWGVAEEDHVLLILSELDANVQLSARNIGKLKMNTTNGLNVYDLLRADKVVIEQSALSYVQSFYGPSEA